VSAPRKTKVEGELTGIDWFRMVIASLGVMFCCRFALSIGPRFQKLLADFGSELPALTRLVLVPWFPLLLGLIPALMVALALAGKPSLRVRRRLIVGALFLSLSASGLCVYGMFSPIFALAEAIK
jgi:type II secretory pathway component PulF